MEKVKNPCHFGGGQLLQREGDRRHGVRPGVFLDVLQRLNMADRLDALGGSISISARPEGGTSVRGTIPVAAPNAAARPLSASHDG